jgi:hypothetical protein
MKKYLALTGPLALFAVLALASPQPPTTYRGQIMDSTCAGNGSHDAGYKLTNTHTPKDCTLACVKGGASLVLYNASDKTTYKLSNQRRAKALAGQDVQVKGTLDPATSTIKVTSITPAKS